MNYELHYNKLIERAKNRLLEGYCESHHIIPRCMGGSDDAENLVDLTPEEHYVAHQLLVKMYPGHDGLVRAMNIMGSTRKTNKLYGWARRKYAEVLKNNTGWKHTEETKAKIAEAHKGKKKTKAHREALSAAKKGMPSPKKGIPTGIVTEGAWKKGNVPWNSGLNTSGFEGMEHTNETKARMSAIANARPKVKCPHCDKIGQKNAMMQHHFDKCKFKKETA